MVVDPRIEGNDHVPDLDTGEVLSPCKRCATVNPGDVDNLERENRKLMRRIRQLERDQEEERMADPNRRIVLGIIERWKVATNHPRSNSNAADRYDLVRARLREGYTPENLELAVDGIGAYRYVVSGERKTEGATSQRHDRLGIALGSGEAVERFANLGHTARKAGIIPPQG